MDLDRFYRLKARIRQGFTLNAEERSEYRKLGRAWIALFKEVNDKRAIDNMRRDLNLLKRKPKPKANVMREVML